MSAATGPTGTTAGTGAGAGLATTTKETKEVITTANPLVMAYGSLMVVFSVLFALFFSLGAALLSYRKFQSLGWAFLDFWFPYFYYPYYAFFINEAPPPSTSILGMTGGMKKVMKWFNTKRH
jgi:hypothetical protein